MVIGRGKEVEGGEPALDPCEVLEAALGWHIVAAFQLDHLDLPLATRCGTVEVEGQGGGVGSHVTHVNVHYNAKMICIIT